MSVTAAIGVLSVVFIYDGVSNPQAQNDLVCGVLFAKFITQAVTSHSCGARGDESARRGKGEWSTPHA